MNGESRMYSSGAGKRVDARGHLIDYALYGAPVALRFFGRLGMGAGGDGETQISRR
jgi:hypothetical protein